MSTKAEDQTGQPRPQSGRLLLVVGVILLLVLAAWVLRRCRQEVPALSEFTNVAVLPLTNSTGDPTLSYLAGGLSSDLRARLSELQGLQLATRSETWSTAEGDLDLQQVAQELGVELIVHGDLSQQGGNLRVLLEVFDARTHSALGSIEQQRPRERLFGLQQRIAKDVAGLIGVAQTRRERSRLWENATRSLKAYDYYLRGLQYLDDWTNPRGADFAVDLLRQAVQLDPQYPRAHADLSKALWRSHLQDHRETGLSEAHAEAALALDLDSRLPAAHVAVARLVSSAKMNSLSNIPKPDEIHRELAADFLNVGELEKAESSLRAAVDLGSQNWRNAYLLAVFLERSGRLDEAASVFQTAGLNAPSGIWWPQEALVNLKLADGDLDGALTAFESMGADAVLQPETLIGIGRAYLLAGRTEKTEVLYRHATELSPENHRYRRLLGDVLARLEQADKAMEQHTAAFELVQDELVDNPHDAELELLATLYAAKAQRCAEALPRAATLRRHLPDNAETSYEIALVYSLCKDREMTLYALRAAIGFGVSPQSIENTRDFEWLVDDPQFLELIAAPSAVPPRP